MCSIMIFIMHMHLVYNINKWSYSISITQHFSQTRCLGLHFDSLGRSINKYTSVFFFRSDRSGDVR